MQNIAGLYAVQPTGGAFVHDELEAADVLHVFGDVDLSNVADFEKAISGAAHENRMLVIDLSECRFIDSSAIAGLIRAHTRFGSSLRLIVTESGNIARVLSICKLDSVFSIMRSIDDVAGETVVAA